MIGRDAKIPASNRGSKFLNGRTPRAVTKRALVSANLDFLSFTCPHLAVFGPAVDEETMRRRAAQFLLSLAPCSGIAVGEEVKGFRRFYAHHFQLLTPDGADCGDICFGGDHTRGTVSVQLTGAACARIEAGFDHEQAWSQVRVLLETVGATLTRVDVAHDSYDGTHGLALARSLYEAGEFVSGGRPPAANEQGWNDGSGLTLYIGKSSGRSQLVVYEKGREQGYRDGEEYAEWVRWEARFYRRKGYEIPLEVITSPAAYLVGKYPPLSWISAVMCRIKSSLVRTKANLTSAMRHCRRQYGGLLNLLTKMSDDAADLGDVVASFLTRPTVPAWVTANPFGAETIADAHPLRPVV